MAIQRQILIVVTNVGYITENRPTGLWLEEFAIPYNEFISAGYKVIVASPLGGKIPLDPRSTSQEIPEAWQPAVAVLQDTQILLKVKDQEFDALILPGGHGPMFDLSRNYILAELLKRFMVTDKIIGAVCHGPAGLVNTFLDNGQSLVANKRVTGFSNVEEEVVQLTKLVSFLLEDKLKELGGNYISKAAWQEHVVIDGNLITGQNPQSSAIFAKAIVDKLREQ